LVKVEALPRLNTSGTVDCRATPLSTWRLLDAGVFMEFALSTRDVEAAVRESSNVDDVVPSDVVPVLTVIVSVLMVELLPANTSGVVIERLPVLTV